MNPTAEAVHEALNHCNYTRSPAVAIEPDIAFIDTLQARVAREGLSQAAKDDIEHHFLAAFEDIMTGDDAAVAAEQVVDCVEGELSSRPYRSR